jgi:hypothetical protein
MDIINRAGVDVGIVRTAAQHSLVSHDSFVIFLDDAVNRISADCARAKLEEYRQKGWKPLAAWERDAAGETDTHACTVSRRIIANQQLPFYVIAAIGGYELLVYLDATWTGGPETGFAVTLAHELRHVWQYFNAPVVFHAQTPLSWVVPPQLTPCELDAEKAAKRVLRQMYGGEGVRSYLETELVRCKPKHREVLERLTALDETADPQIEEETIALLEQHAAAIRNFQHQYYVGRPPMPGIPELCELLRGRSDVKLRP